MAAAGTRKNEHGWASGQGPFPHLAKPLTLAGLTIRNRTLMAAMSSGLASGDGEATAAGVAYYRARAEGGTGMIVVEFSGVNRAFGRAEARQLMLDRDSLLPGHLAIAEAIRSAGASAAIQLHLPGQFAAPGTTDGLPSGPSDEYSRREPSRQLSRAMTESEINEAIDSFAAGARRALRAGYEAIELHGAHGYLLAAFLSPLMNRRDDGWGGDFERRLLFPTRVVKAIRAEIGSDVPLIYRLSSDDFQDGGTDLDATLRIVPELVAAGVDAIDVSSGSILGTLDRTVDPMNVAQAWRTEHAAKIKAVAGTPVFCVGPFREPELAERALASGATDMVALGRPLLADPEWTGKALGARVNDIRPCTNCNWCFSLVLAHQSISCAENPAAGHELEPLPRRSGAARNAVVVGGGPGGMAAALDLHQAGFDTTLFETRRNLGGGLAASAAPPHKEKLLWYLDYLKGEIERCSLSLSLGRRADARSIAGLAPDVVILATGAVSKPPEFEGREQANVISAYSVLYGDADLPSPGALPALVYGGGETGCEMAEYLADRGRPVILVSRSDRRKLSRDAEPIYRKQLLQRLMSNPRVRVRDNTHLISVSGNMASLAGPDGLTDLEVGHVFVAQGRNTGSSLAAELEAAGIRFEVIGDAAAIGRIGDAVHAARRAVRALAVS